MSLPNTDSTSDLSVDDERSVDRVADAYSQACLEAARAGVPGPDLDPFIVHAGLNGCVATEARRRILPIVPGYSIHGELGRGGMGRVYRATEDATGRAVAVKAVAGGELARLPRLEELIPKLTHEHIISIERVVRTGGEVFLVMRLVEDGNLKNAISRWSAIHPHCLPEDIHKREQRIAVLLRQLTDAVRHLHDRAIMHRDLKPANILIEGDKAFVCDFGLARLVERTERDLTVTGGVVGTVGYMAPEQIEGRHDQTVAVDVYALGAILYELLVGHPPFAEHGATENSIKSRRTKEELPLHPHDLNSRVAPESDVAWLALQCLHRDPARRLSVELLAALLQDFLDGKPLPRDTRGLVGVLIDSVSGEILDPDYPRRWFRALATEGITCPLSHIGMFLLLSNSTQSWVLWMWLLATDTLLGWGIWLRTKARHRYRLTPMEWQIVHIWIAATLGEFVVFALHCPLGEPVDPNRVIQFYSMWAVMRAVVFFIEGHLFWKRLRLVSVTFLVAAIVMPWLGLYAALLYGFLTGGWFFWQSLHVPAGTRGEPANR